MDLSGIPKVVHYCWFGKGPKSALAERCLTSWTKHLPGYEIKEWNERSFDVSGHPYTAEAYQLGKHAFVADYVRLHALSVHGGIYLDTDVEILRSPDEVLISSGVLGFESPTRVCSAFLAFVPQHEFIGEWLDSYRNRTFLSNGRPDETTNVQVLTGLLRRRGLVMDGTRQRLPGDLVVYPAEVFSPYSYGARKPQVTENTVAIHWLEASWVAGWARARLTGIKVFKRLFGVRLYDRVHALWMDGKR